MVRTLSLPSLIFNYLLYIENENEDLTIIVQHAPKYFEEKKCSVVELRDLMELRAEEALKKVRWQSTI